MDIILGAGITGLSYALYSGSDDWLILERELEAGGYCRTTRRNGFVWDYSGHFFHFRDDAIKNMILSGLGDDVASVVKHTRIRYGDTLVDYPFQKNIHQLPKDELIECLYDLFSRSAGTGTGFRDMLVEKFGKSIAEKFLIPYNEKLYACDLNTLDRDAMGRFFPYAEPEEIVRNFKSGSNASYNDTFIYPRQGAAEYVRSILGRLDASKIRCGASVAAISPAERTVTLTSGERLRYDRLISTVPFPQLLDMAGIDYDRSIYTWNQVLVFNLGFDRKGADTFDHWLYFPDKKYCFYRVGFYDNILSQERMSLYVELGFGSDAVIEPREWLDRVLCDLKSAGIVSAEQHLVDSQSIIMNPAYVHINSRSTADVEARKRLLADSGIYSIGRYGSWCYCSIEDNIIEAKSLAGQLNTRQ